MVIEVVHGLQATGVSLNDRFSLLLAASMARPQRRRSVSGNFQKGSFRNQQLLEEFAGQDDYQASRPAVRQRLGFPQGGLRRFGSETSLPGMRRSNSFGNLSHGYQRMQWRGSQGNLSRSASYGNLSTLGRGRGRGYYRARGRGAWPGRGGVRGAWRTGRPGLRGARGAGAARGPRGRGRGRGGARPQRPTPSKEELDHQLEQYMAGTKAALDRELDTYMQTALEMEL